MNIDSVCVVLTGPNNSVLGVATTQEKAIEIALNKLVVRKCSMNHPNIRGFIERALSVDLNVTRYVAVTGFIGGNNNWPVRVKISRVILDKV